MVERLKSLWTYRDLVKHLVIKDLKLKYRRSFLGYVWSVLNPLLVMIIMAIIFSSIFKRNIENYPVYLFTGQIMFNYMNVSSRQALESITGNAALLKKVYVPKYIFTFSKITSGLVDLVFSLGALVLVMIGTGARFSWYNLLIFFPIIQLYVFCVGLGMLLSALNVFFRDIQYIWNAITTAWLYATPIFYTLDMMDSRLAWVIKHFNPMYFYIGQFRDLIYSNQMPGAGIMIEGCVTAIISLMIGTAVFWKKQDEFILYI
ncbi:MAG: ABC transporter permease [Lachnospiraceae bacterium]|nr:ABC transporter permease [Lachnospiraceae bacterium]